MHSNVAQHASAEEYRAFHRERIATLRALIERHVPQRVAHALDVGGGGDAGGLGEWLREEKAGTLHAVDTGDDAARARELGIDAHRCDIDREPLPFDDASMQLIIFSSVIEHLFNPHFALREIVRVMAPQALLILEAPNAVSLGRRLAALRGRNPFAQFHAYNFLEDKAFMVHCSVFYTPGEIRARLGAGFEILEEGYGMHHPPQNALKRALRLSCAKMIPSTSDWFYVAARKKTA